MGFLDKIFRPRMDKFLALLQEQAQSTLAGLELLEEFMHSDSNKNAKAGVKAKKAANEARRILFDELNRTFITPIDREDIFAPSHAIDDIMDILKGKSNHYQQKMASLIRETGSELVLAVHQLREHLRVANDHTNAEVARNLSSPFQCCRLR